MSKIKTHDYSEREWGKNYNIQEVYDDGINVSLCGWGLGIKQGDYILLRNGDDTTRYKFDSITYCSNPHDMWFAKASFSPRT